MSVEQYKPVFDPDDDCWREQSERVCGCGCGASLDGMRKDAIYASAHCRTRDWKRREGYADPRRRKASRNGKTRRSGPSGFQVSRLKAREAAIQAGIEARQEPDVPVADLVDRQMTKAMSERQRALLEQREGACQSSHDRPVGRVARPGIASETRSRGRGMNDKPRTWTLAEALGGCAMVVGYPPFREPPVRVIELEPVLDLLESTLARRREIKALLREHGRLEET